MAALEAAYTGMDPDEGGWFLLSAAMPTPVVNYIQLSPCPPPPRSYYTQLLDRFNTSIGPYLGHNMARLRNGPGVWHPLPVRRRLQQLGVTDLLSWAPSTGWVRISAAGTAPFWSFEKTMELDLNGRGVRLELGADHTIILFPTTSTIQTAISFTITTRQAMPGASTARHPAWGRTSVRQPWPHPARGRVSTIIVMLVLGTNRFKILGNLIRPLPRMYL
ncbi:hypothetical protein BDK51DRAFT_46229 [Blyttiomyces helicus]|uniref:Uncharacterized protein n=1 Tax=Blyttiomyces helicus TaxID=388810 RepID=A0A4P9WJT5_9FUNG|nr:hypothetical protein BDK51DRAFT_46229 [Blyttiomyces helicus]|eukprot:RKO90916.1 hypothetical protein BDK51DRAFT_46229 [Blyttiomyces helicus]